MLISVALTTWICIFLVLIRLSYSVTNDERLELLFTARSPSDWADVWHSEAYSRCRNKLERHLFWACEKDIYRLTRRNNFKTEFEKRSKPFPWIEENDARNFLKVRRLKKAGNEKGITAECCTRVGCTWEEYAEYCPSNKRRNHNNQ
ncbi:probable insulin-like peptide 7 [Condylostylus longicornis]|uniref:probable insulin-like peptide 7 n=1 Tax=Condylostylus longicornis TaxID=2530218 RepID=UPI00244E451C|nr:probable insulin-like peptide 7 [Condylostylus longicornis]